MPERSIHLWLPLCAALAAGCPAVPADPDAVGVAEDAGADAPEADASEADATPMDAGTPDGGPDLPPRDAGTADAGSDPALGDAGVRDAGSDAAVVPLAVVDEAMLLAADGATGDVFGGSSVALSADGSRALVSASGDDTSTGIDSGTARVFVRTGTTWVEEATLAASGGTVGGRFGSAVALSADGAVALVGGYRSGAGGARVFVRVGTTWTEEATLVAPDGEAGDELGYSVSLSADGSRALIGAPNDHTPAGVNAGSARVFVRTGTSWSQEATLLPLDGSPIAPSGAFGWSVSLSADGGRALVGAPSTRTAGVGPGAGNAHVFIRSGTRWTTEATLVAPDGRSDEGFGSSVSLSGDGSRALVSVPNDDTPGGTRAGSVRVFARGGAAWSQEAVLVATDGAVDDLFGRVSLSADGSRALIGIPRDDTPAGADAGSARIFVRTGTTWTHGATLLARDASAGDAFGSSVSLSADGSRCLVGAGNDDTLGGENAGSAHVFALE
jgi:hypothetical protein